MMINIVLLAIFFLSQNSCFAVDGKNDKIENYNISLDRNKSKTEDIIKSTNTKDYYQRSDIKSTASQSDKNYESWNYDSDPVDAKKIKYTNNKKEDIVIKKNVKTRENVRIDAKSSIEYDNTSVENNINNQNVRNGKYDDEFLSYDDYKKAYKTEERGTVKFVNKKGYRVLTQEEYDAKYRQYRFIPEKPKTKIKNLTMEEKMKVLEGRVTTSGDKQDQISPYYMHMYKNRVMAPVHESIGRKMDPVIQEQQMKCPECPEIPEEKKKSPWKYYYYSGLSFLMTRSSSNTTSSYQTTDSGGIKSTLNTFNSKNKYDQNFGASIKTGVGFALNYAFGMRFELDMTYLRMYNVSNTFTNSLGQTSAMTSMYDNPAYKNYGKFDFLNLGANAYLDLIPWKGIYPYVGIGIGTSRFGGMAMMKDALIGNNISFMIGTSVGIERGFYAGYRLIAGLGSQKIMHRGYDVGTGNNYNLYSATEATQTSLVSEKHTQVSNLRIHMIEIGFRF